MKICIGKIDFIEKALCSNSSKSIPTHIWAATIFPVYWAFSHWSRQFIQMSTFNLLRTPWGGCYYCYSHMTNEDLKKDGKANWHLPLNSQDENEVQSLSVASQGCILEPDWRTQSTDRVGVGEVLVSLFARVGRWIQSENIFLTKRELHLAHNLIKLTQLESAV